MIPVHHPNGSPIGAPHNWDRKRHGPCSTLSVANVQRNGLRFMESLWEPTPEELEALQQGGKVVLQIEGSSHPVVSMGVSVPNVDPDWIAIGSLDSEHEVQMDANRLAVYRHRKRGSVDWVDGPPPGSTLSA